MDAAGNHFSLMCAIGLMFTATTCRQYGLLAFFLVTAQFWLEHLLKDVINSCLLVLAKSHGQTSMTPKVRIPHKEVFS